MYTTIDAPCEARFEEKRSEFIAFIYPIGSREEALSYVQTLRERFPDARHHCWAYILGAADQPKNAAFNDDGEPGGTAGKPMLHVLTQRGAGDCCAVVVRYFGGIKLGAGGLVRAYGQAVSQALDKATWRTILPKQELVMTCGFEDEPHIRHLIEQHQGELINVSYSHLVTLSVSLETTVTPTFQRAVQERTAGRATCQLHS